MTTGDFDLGQKMKILNFLIWYDESTKGKKKLYMKSGFKVKRRRKKRVKSREKNFNFFLFMHFYWGGKFFINKKGLFYARFFEFEVKS